MIDTSNLAEKLSALNGLTFEECEKEERMAGNTSVDVTFSKSFQARLAARALGVNVYDIKELPLKQYSKVVNETMTFLFSSSEESGQPSEKSEK